MWWRGGATGRALDLRQVVGLNPTRGKSCVTTLGKLFTPRLCASVTKHQKDGLRIATEINDFT